MHLEPMKYWAKVSSQLRWLDVESSEVLYHFHIGAVLCLFPSLENLFRAAELVVIKKKTPLQ